MIKKIVLTVLLLLSAAFAREKTELIIVSIDSDGRGASVKGGDIQKGAYGIVVTNLIGSKDSIVAGATALNSGSEVKIRFEVLSDLAQDALPRALVLPRVGDRVIFYSFDDRSVVIAKNQADYQNVIESENKSWLHPDLFSALLDKERVGEPKREHFSSFCKIYSVGTVYFAVQNKIFIVDCQSFETLSTREFQSSGSKEFESPFFHRTGEIDTGYLGFGQESVENFEQYYLGLIGR